MIAQGTIILLEDDSTIAVEEITSSHVVRTRDGTNEAVLGCSLVADFHVLLLRFEDGHQLFCNDNQLIAFPNGYVPAATVSPGQEVYAVDGIAHVSDAEQYPEARPVYELITAGSGEYIANGIVCKGGTTTDDEPPLKTTRRS